MKPILVALARVTGYFAAVFAVGALALVPMAMALGDLDSIQGRLEILVIGVTFLAGAAVVTAGMAWIGKSPLARSGWPDRRAGARGFAAGTLIGLAMAGGVLALTWAAGGARLSISGEGLSQYLRYSVPLVGVLLVAAVAEEWIFRGYPLAALSTVMSRGWANVLVAVVFTAGHWGGSGWNSLTVINIFLFSLVNGSVRFSRGGVPAASGFHFAWNSTLVLAGAIMTGDEGLRVPTVHFSGQGPDWLSGGAFGPEGAIATTVVTTVGIALIWRYWLSGRLSRIGARR